MWPDFDMEFGGIFDSDGNDIKIETFKDIAVFDMENIFFNLDEFAEKHFIGEKEVPVVIDNDKMNELIESKFMPLERVYQKMILFYVKKDLLGFIPEIDDNLFFDDELYQVADVTYDGFDVLIITIGKNIGV